MNCQNTEDGATELKVKFTAHIKKYLFTLTTNDVRGIRYRMLIAEKLIRLLELFQTSDKKAERKIQFDAFLCYIDEEFKLKRASYFAYKCYYEFLQEYPRFQYTPISFTSLARNVKKLRDWFNGLGAQDGRSKYHTASYWRSIPTEEHNASSKFLVDGGIDEIDFEVSELEYE
jgi:hypothetical protein